MLSDSSNKSDRYRRVLKQTSGIENRIETLVRHRIVTVLVDLQESTTIILLICASILMFCFENDLIEFFSFPLKYAPRIHTYTITLYASIIE